MQIIGHRGAKGLAPENTLAGIKFALRRNVDWVEFDVRCTKDNQLVVVHDATLLRLARSHHRVRGCTLAEIKEIATNSGETIPTIQEVLRVIGRRAKVMIELKEPSCIKPVVTEISRQIEAGRSYEDFLVNSSSVLTLRKVQKLNRKIRLTFLHHYEEAFVPLRFLAIRSVKLYAVGFWSFVAPRYLIQAAKKRGLWVIVYTINHRAQAKKLEDLGVDAIMTDRPQEFLPLWSQIARQLAIAIVVILVGWLLWNRFRFAH